MKNYAPIDDHDEIWMRNLARAHTRSLQSMLRRYWSYLAHKLSVAAGHRPGTAYHTRATREAETARWKIEKIEAELNRHK